ncbi:MAG TPA: ABC transporter permease [Blastocatellia bacterium]|nr:ABC transporter permease [Blastocatellia bacterium]
MNTLKDIAVVFRIYLTKLRGESGPFLLTSFLFPAGMYLFLSVIAGDNHLNKVQLLAGSMVFSTTMVSIMWVGYHLLEDRFRGRIKLFVTTPIRPISYIMGIVCFASMQATLGIIGLLIVGKVIGLPIHLSLLMLPLLALGMLAHTAISIIISRFATSMPQGTLITDGLGAGLVFFSPVYYNISQLPPGISHAVYILPPTFMADGLRKLLTGNSNVGIDLLVLGAMATISLLVSLKMTRWRED